MIALASVTSALAGATFRDASDQLDGVELVSFSVVGSGYSGVATVDHDRDGDLDLYFGNGPGQGNPLLRNDGQGRFEDVAAEAGADAATGTGGVLAADLDGDAFPDLVLPGDRAPLRVLANDGDGTFTDRTLFSGLSGSRRNTSAHAADIDLDGDLDVYVGGGVVPDQIYLNTLWRNEGDRTFTEIGAAAGVDTQLGACAATFTDLDDDLALDLLVANCNDLDLVATPFEVWRNRGDGTFEDFYDESGIWRHGHWMAFAMLDYDNDLALDFFSTNIGTVGLRDGPHALYRNLGGGDFTDVAAYAGVANLDFGWGAVAADFDNDGWEDLYYVGMSHAPDLAQSPGHLLTNRGDGTFEPPVQPLDLTGRFTSGLATGDVDGDGFMDLVVVVTESPSGEVPGLPVLLLNEGNDNHGLVLRLRDPTTANEAGIGARVWATTGERTMLREVNAGSSYLSTNSPWPHFGLGAEIGAEVCVRWPGGASEDFGRVDAGTVDLVRGTGTPVDRCVVPEAPTPNVPPTDEGCGCASGTSLPGPAGLAPILLALVVSVRRRRSATSRRSPSRSRPRCTR